MLDIFYENKIIIIFLHVLSAVIWVGGMIAMRYAAYPSFLDIESPAKRLAHISKALKRLFYIVFPFTIILLVTAIFIAKGYNLSYGEHDFMSKVKKFIWIIMFLNLIVMMLRRSSADKLMQVGDFAKAKVKLELIGKFMVPLNIILGIIGIFIGTYFSSIF